MSFRFVSDGDVLHTLQDQSVIPFDAGNKYLSDQSVGGLPPPLL